TCHAFVVARAGSCWQGGGTAVAKGSEPILVFSRLSTDDCGEAALRDRNVTETRKQSGASIVAAGTGINLALGILYAWSVLKGGIPAFWGWSEADKTLPYSVASFVFALTMVPAGALQDKIGPRWVATIGGLLTGAGFVISARSGSSLGGFVVGFGVVAGL